MAGHSPPGLAEFGGIPHKTDTSRNGSQPCIRNVSRGQLDRGQIKALFSLEISRH
jgi:hypothetical protein